ncbi:AbgT family transporter [Prolixibacteraceae bacterium Z1-6]|uniref:AbgT family transporter n=1 Tax=Draconibacterium aestuarii TaxID=2998507 RepID=A0A9X3J6L8_9BACT|nr:AbgT family transporter [Prolixibacteraceae bacterium Z1-6]
MLSYFVLIVPFMQKYDSRAGVGTIVSTMLSYPIAFLFGWAILLIIRMIFGMPIGPDSPLFYQM